MNQKDDKILQSQVDQVAINPKNPKLQKAKTKLRKQLQNAKTAAVAKSPALPVSRKNPIAKDPIQDHPLDRQLKILAKATTHLHNRVNISKVRQSIKTKNLNGKRITMKTLINQTVSKTTEVEIDHVENVEVEEAIDSLKIDREVISINGTTTEAREETSRAKMMTEEIQTIVSTTMIVKEASTVAVKENETSTPTETTKIVTTETTRATITTTAETTTAIQETTILQKTTSKKTACYSLATKRASTTKTWTIDDKHIHLLRKYGEWPQLNLFLKRNK